MFKTGQVIGLYTLVKRIGRGGFGEVWLAERRAKFVTTKVAVKLPLEEQVDTNAIKNEAVLWEQASGHPNVMPIIEADEYDGQIVIVSEYAPDGSLDELLKREGSLPVRKAVELLIGVLNGLEFLHSKKIIHRDLKPANILLQGETPRLTDFGVSRVLKTTNISVGLSGTPSYMAPEAFDGKRTIQTDIWSVGAMLYEMLNGALPFPHSNLTDLFGAIVRDEPDPFLESVPAKLRSIVLRAMAKNPADRHQTAKEMRDVLADFLVIISQQNLEPTLLNEHLVSTLRIEPLVSPHIPVPATADQATDLTERSDGVSPHTNVVSQKQSGRYRSLSITAAIAVLLLTLAGSSYYLLKAIGTNKTSSANSGNTADITLIPYLKGDKFGFCDPNGKLVIDAKYDYVRPFSEGLAIVNIGRDKDQDYARDGKWGALDKSGVEVIPLKYDDLTDFADGVAITNVGMDWDANGKFVAFGKYGVIDRFGSEIVPPKYDKIGRFSEGLASVEQNNKFGFIDRGGNVVIPLTYADAGTFSDGAAWVQTGSRIRGIAKTGWTISTMGGKSGLIDMSGIEFVQPKYDWIGRFSDKLVDVRLNGNCGYIGRDGQFKIPSQYKDCRSFSEGLAAVKIGGKWGFIDKNGDLVIPAAYDIVDYFSEGLAWFNVGAETDVASAATQDDILYLKGKWGLIDKSGNVVLPIKYDSVFAFEYNLARVNVGFHFTENADGTFSEVSRGRWGFIDRSGNEVIALKYSHLGDFKNGFAEVTLDEKIFYIDRNGREFYEP